MATATKQAESKDKAEKKAESKPKAKRTTLTLEQKIERAEQQARDLRAKAAEKRTKQVEDLTEKKAKLVEKRDALSREIAEIDVELDRHDNAPVVGDPVVAASDAANAPSVAASESDLPDEG